MLPFCNSRILCKRIFITIGLSTVIGLPICPLASAQSNIQWVDGAVTSATIEAISVDGIVSGDGVPTNTKLEKIAAYQTEATSIARGAVEVLIAEKGKLFTNGIEIQDAAAKLSFPSNTTIELSLDLVQAVVFKRTQRVNKQLANRSNYSDSEDTVIVDTPDGEKAVAGIFEGLSQGKLGLNFNGKSRKIGIEKINAVSLADLGLKTFAGTRMELTNGAVLNGKIQRVENGTVHLAVTPNHTIEFPWSSVKRLQIQSDNLVYLSNLEPVAVEEKAIFAPQRSWQRDRSIESNPIRLRGPQHSSLQTYRKGIGTQSYCSLRFANTNQFERFQAVAGIDAETQGRGDCQMSVYADGIKLWSQRITADTAPASIDVDISAMAEVTLVVEPGQQFDLADHANWADAKFVKP